MNKIMCFSLTEPHNGSDASAIKTKAVKVEGGYLLTGQKRWIGNGTMADYMLTWAKNENEGGKVQAFVVDRTSKGVETKKMDNKYALRIV